jgi:aquaporin Z
LKASFPEAVFLETRGGGLSVSLDLTGGQAFLLEAIGTFFLVFVIFGTAVDLRSPKVGGLAIGFTLSAVILAIGPLTGSALNPARALGPAVATGIYEAQLLYWFAPITGGLAAALLYEYLFMQRGREPVDHGELKP